MSKKQNTRVLTQQRRHRRQWLTFLRMCRYGVNNLSRNLWLTIAATVVMTITLLVIFTTVVAQSILQDSVDMLSKKVDMSIYLKGDTPASVADDLMQKIRTLPNVTDVRYVTADQARQEYIDRYKSDARALNAVNNATNRFFASIRVNLQDINDTSSLDTFVKQEQSLKSHLDPERAPSFAGERRETIKNLGKGIDFAQKAGLSASILFVAISSLIVFNTIRMAIFNRRDEIEMMKLIGANRGFIRGPFVVEAIVYGVIAALLATLIGFVVMVTAGPGLEQYGVAIGRTSDTLVLYLPLVVLAMCGVGALIGTASSLLATRKYLKLR